MLYAPGNGVVRNRILEKGDMASPQKPVYNISLNHTKWVRAYLTESQLGKVKPGFSATVRNDSFPDTGFKGTVGFISSVAEFTPKNVETPDLRTALVYEVRIIVDDPDNRLRLGAPPPSPSPGPERRNTDPGTAQAMTTESQPLIDCRNVRKIFPDSAGVPFAAVDDVSFRLSAGEIVGLLGPDGAGKTTLIRLITGLMKPHGGSISVLNLDSVKKSRSIQASIGYMPQKFGLYEDLTVRENMELYARMHGVYGQDREKRFRSLLSMTSLERFTTRLAGKLSGGMKQKLGLCCSLVSSPPLILLDEPTVGVDPLSRRELWNILGQFSHEEGVGVLVSTSYMDESAYCNRTLIMYKGGLLMDAPPADVIARAEGMCITVRTRRKASMRASSRAGWPPCPELSTPLPREAPCASSCRRTTPHGGNWRNTTRSRDSRTFQTAS